MIDLDVAAPYKLTEWVGTLKSGLRHRLRDEVSGLAHTLAGIVQGRAPRKSGRLSMSVDDGVTETATAVMGRVSVKVPYAHFIEDGFAGTEEIKTHLRRMKQAFGRPIPPRLVAVQAHNRSLDFAGESFLRPILAAWEPEIRTRLAKTIDQVVTP